MRLRTTKNKTLKQKIFFFLTLIFITCILMTTHYLTQILQKKYFLRFNVLPSVIVIKVVPKKFYPG